ncbi:conserved Plasmodium protein, unknown function [Plasmodium vinckei vinckei]|uniref:Uncharacterized protein n=1 Tax=Plasmodium vinckei vinckei TaxID=54757 RepID=A0A449BU85_PLAVN|nr:conserved Plasmodium protein, unknown function [Plasmodium vinckei vinckei]VEV57014.1 conserved Plasmodium protein, unknown function [Plasmodium vinckei vinckei]
MVNLASHYNCHSIGIKCPTYQINILKGITEENINGNKCKLGTNYKHLFNNPSNGIVGGYRNSYFIKTIILQKGHKLKENKKNIIILKKKDQNINTAHVRNLKIACTDDNILNQEQIESSNTENNININNQPQIKNNDMLGECEYNIEKERDYDIKNGEENNSNKLSDDLLDEINMNKITEEENSIAHKNMDDDGFDILKHFNVENDNSLISNVDPEKSKDLINSNYFKNMMKELNLNEDEILSMIRKNEKNVTKLISENLTVEQIEKRAKNEEKRDEELFDAYMNNNLRIGNYISFKKIGKKYKDIIKEVITILLHNNIQFKDIIKDIEEGRYEINKLISILKHHELFTDLDNSVLDEIIKKSVLMGYLNEKFSNDIHDFEWNKNFENIIFNSINNDNFKLRDILCTYNSINVSIANTKKTDIDSEEYDEIENSIKYSISEYEKNNSLDILSFFSIFVNFN